MAVYKGKQILGNVGVMPDLTDIKADIETNKSNISSLQSRIEVPAPPQSGTYVLQSVDGVMQWVNGISQLAIGYVPTTLGYINVNEKNHTVADGAQPIVIHSINSRATTQTKRLDIPEYNGEPINIVFRNGNVADNPILNINNDFVGDIVKVGDKYILANTKYRAIFVENKWHIEPILDEEIDN